MTNGHTKRSNSGPSRPTLKLRICRSTVSKKPKDSDSDVSESEVTTDSDSSDSAPVRRTRARTAVPSVSADTDSGDNYTPGGRSKQVRKNRGKNIKNGKQSKSKVKSNVIADDDDDDDDDEYVAERKTNEDNEEDEEEFLAPNSTEEESEEEKIIKRDTRSRKLVTESVQNQKYTANNGKNDNSDSESEDDDEEEEQEEEEEEEEEQPQIQHKANNQDSEDSDYSYSKVLRSRSSRRKQHIDSEDIRQYTRRSAARKRPCYNEDSDDSTAMPVRNRRKIKRRSYAEDSDESIAEPGISISSRGRIRKMTPRARAYLLESP